MTWDRVELKGLLVRASLSLALLAPARAFAQGAPAMDSTMQHPTPSGAGTSTRAMTMAPGPLGISREREGSGTSWLPDATPMAAVHSMAGPWELMLHGNVFVQYIDQGSDRGESQFGSINWLMGMARRPWAGGELGLRAMMSAEPFTIPGCGYPVLLATGELCDGAPIHDAQHPHDLFMELAGQYQRPIGDRLALQLYGGPAGEPALGPVAFPHRTSALANPLAPISHHWFDATHISFGVATAGLYGRRWKLEGSLFNGREPDEHRLDLDLAPLDSYSGRVWLTPNERWAIQLSAGRLHEAEPAHEPGEPRVDVTRYTTSASYHRPLEDGGTWASTAGFGRNVELGESSNALLLESALSIGDRHLFFGRAEWSEKSGEDLDIHPPPIGATSEIANFGTADRSYGIGAVALGYARQFDPYHGWLPGVGARASLNFIPGDLEPYYGQGNPTGFGLTLYVSLRPAAMAMGMGQNNEGMGSQPMPAMEHAQMDMPPSIATDSTMMAHPVSQDSTGMAHGMGADTASGAGVMSDEHMRRMREILTYMTADPVIRERIASDPVLQGMIDELNRSMPTTVPGGHAMEGMGAAGKSDEERALDFIVRLLSKPEVEARIHSDPRLHQLWNDPAVQARLTELRGRQPAGRN